MDSMAAGGAVFTQALTTSPQTLPSLASLHTGLYPPAHGARDDGRGRLAAGVRTIAEAMRASGRRTAAFPAALPLHPRHGLDRGFETYAEAYAEIPRPSAVPEIGIPADRIAGKAIEWLEGLRPDERFFLWVNFFDPHYFHDPPQPFRETFADRPYDGEVAFVDRELGRLLRWLSEHGREAGALYVLAGNHGEGLGEGGEEYHGILLREATLRVPLAVRPPRGGAAPGAPAASQAPAARVADPAGLADVAPTILDLAGAGPVEGMQGVSLAGYLGRGARPDPARTIYFETTLPRTLFGWSPLRGARSGGLKYVEAPGAGRASLHDVAADPGEARDLAAERPDEARRLAAETARVAGDGDARAASLPEAVAAQVRELGLPADPPAPPATDPAARVAVGNDALKAHRSHQRRMVQAAVFLFRSVLENDPDNYLGLVGFASLNMQARNPLGAEKLLERAQARYPADGEVYHLLGHLAIMMARGPEDIGRAARLFETAVRLDPVNEEALYDSACAVAGKKADQALAYLDAAVRNGFRDFSHMALDGDLDPIRGTERFRAITGGRAVAPPPPAAPGSPEAPAAPASAPGEGGAAAAPPPR
jgi:arylsulfatase A-like enzyme